MKHITFYLDFVSPYAWLAYERLPDALEGLSYSVSYKPVLLGALLQQHANPRPAGIAPNATGLPPRHLAGPRAGHAAADAATPPVQPAALLRQALVCGDDGCINRFVAGALLRHVWQGGHDALDAERLRVLAEQLSEQIRPGQGHAQRWPQSLLRANTEAARPPGCLVCPPLRWTASCSGARWLAHAARVSGGRRLVRRPAVGCGGAGAIRVGASRQRVDLLLI